MRSSLAYILPASTYTAENLPARPRQPFGNLSISPGGGVRGGGGDDDG